MEDGRLDDATPGPGATSERERGPDATREPDTPPELDGTEWRVVDVAGARALATVQPTIRFLDGSVGGRGGVNTYRGPYQLVGDRLTVGPVISTLMAGPQDAMAQEHRWFTSLAHPSIVRSDDGALLLDHEDGTTSRLVPVGPFVRVSGVVTYLPRIAMLPGSEVVVVLEDTDRADASAIVIAQQIVREAGNVPVPFELSVDRSAVASGARLGLRAQIHHAGELAWATDAHHPVDLDAEPQPHELVVRRPHG